MYCDDYIVSDFFKQNIEKVLDMNISSLQKYEYFHKFKDTNKLNNMNNIYTKEYNNMILKCISEKDDFNMFLKTMEIYYDKFHTLIKFCKYSKPNSKIHMYILNNYCYDDICKQKLKHDYIEYNGCKFCDKLCLEIYLLN